MILNYHLYLKLNLLSFNAKFQGILLLIIYLLFVNLFTHSLINVNGLALPHNVPVFMCFICGAYIHITSGLVRRADVTEGSVTSIY